ncbi:hypothetical protein [Streptomyces sp. 184]|uniref:hypothetical protein n=1 Tax=Streptomyces sp. 184 TaxID=1827526 RepID=UPI0038913534
MRRRFVHALAWTLATLAAVTVSWFGVRLMLDSTSDRPHTVPLSGRAPSESATATEPPSVGTATDRPARPSPTPTRTTPSATESSREPERTATADSPDSPDRPDSPDERAADAARQDVPAASATGDVQTYPVAGGRVTFEMAADSAELVSATPDAGWQMQTWEQTTWIRVDFVAGSRRTSVICTWHDSEPRVETTEYAT